MKKIILAAAIGLLASGCTHWEKPGATKSEFEQTKNACRAKAYAQLPPNMRQVQVTSGYTSPAHTSCYGYGYNINCTTTGGQYHPPSYMSVDDNERYRNQAVDSCLMGNGWRRVKN